MDNNKQKKKTSTDLEKEVLGENTAEDVSTVEVEEVPAEEVEVTAVEEVKVEKPEPIYLVSNNSKFDYKAMKYCNLYIIKYQRKSFVIYLVMAAIVLGIAVWTLIQYINGQGSILFPILFAAFAAYMIYQSFNIEKALDRQLVSYFYNKKVTEQVVEFSDETIRVTRVGDGMSGEPIVIDWLQVTEIVELPQYYYLFLGKNTPLIIDRDEDAMINGIQADLKAIIDEKAKAKPYKKLDKDIVKRPITYVHQEIVPEDTEEADVTEEVTVEEVPAEDVKVENIEDNSEK